MKTSLKLIKSELSYVFIYIYHALPLTQLSPPVSYSTKVNLFIIIYSCSSYILNLLQKIGMICQRHCRLYIIYSLLCSLLIVFYGNKCKNKYLKKNKQEPHKGGMRSPNTSKNKSNSRITVRRIRFTIRQRILMNITGLSCGIFILIFKTLKVFVIFFLFLPRSLERQR